MQITLFNKNRYNTIKTYTILCKTWKLMEIAVEISLSHFIYSIKYSIQYKSGIAFFIFSTIFLRFINKLLRTQSADLVDIFKIDKNNIPIVVTIMLQALCRIYSTNLCKQKSICRKSSFPLLLWHQHKKNTQNNIY